DCSALGRFRRLVEAQGGDPATIDDAGRLPRARFTFDLPAPRSGTVHRLGARAVGEATMKLGAGRARVDSIIDPAVGVVLHKKVGDPVTVGEPLCTIHANDEATLHDVAAPMLLAAYEIGEVPVEVPNLIVEGH